MNEINKEIAFQVILPKLQMICSKEEIKSVPELRKKFNSTYEESISAAKFQEWIDLLEVKFTKKVVIEWPAGVRPAGRPPAVPQDDDLGEQQDELADDFPPTSASAMRMDAFNQMSQ